MAMQSRDAACPRSESNPSFLPLSWEAVSLPHQQLLLQPWGQPGANKGGERQGRAQGCLILCRQTSVLLHTHTPGTSPKIVHSFPSVSPSPLPADNQERLPGFLWKLGTPNKKCLQKPHFHLIHMFSGSSGEPETHTK